MARKLDIALVGTCAVAVVLEVLLQPELPHRPAVLALGLSFAGALWFRRTHPLGATVTAFSLATVATVLGFADAGPYTGIFILVLPYSLCRWSSARDVAIGTAFIAVAYGASVWRSADAGLDDVIGGVVVMLFPGAVGVAVRFRAAAEARAVEQAKLVERAQLARELHDSVAHHLTAIMLQAQGAQARPDAAATALSAIVSESRQTLAELRSIVGALRDDEAAALVPAGGIADIAAFARDAGDTPAVVVELKGDLEGVAAAVERAIYRLAQEAITNAMRHAKNATRIDVRVSAEADVIQLTATDDGQTPSRRNAGFGLVGMAERAALLGGTFEAGPGTTGWRLSAVLPRKGSAV
ncbi:MAG: sensor histidine kinase [Myxococcaceae bacterium]|nr:sensor histidine kinase [Myxococcaceae bacterium]